MLQQLRQGTKETASHWNELCCCREDTPMKGCLLRRTSQGEWSTRLIGAWRSCSHSFAMLYVLTNRISAACVDCQGRW
jgi:hypothetical protein